MVNKKNMHSQKGKKQKSNTKETEKYETKRTEKLYLRSSIPAKE